MGLAIYALPVRAKPFQGRFRVAAKRAVGAEAMVAGESGVAAPALPPQSKTRWLQPSPWDGHGRRSLYAGGYQLYGRHRTGNERQMPWFTVNSNDFQSIPITF